MDIALKYYDKWEHIQHAMNVGAWASAVASSIGLDTRLAYEGGLLHDVGKCYCAVEHHAKIGFIIINETEKYDMDVAKLALYHHQFQANEGIPDLVTDPDDKFMEMAEIIALCDKTEAYTNRRRLPPNKAVKSALSHYPFKHADVLLKLLTRNRVV